MGSAALNLPSVDSAVSFELDRLDFGPGGRIELAGRWFGIKGRRFVRPTLTLGVAGETCRLLADLEHKPWAAEEGEVWVAAFTGAPEPGDVNELELAVAPDIAVPLESPAGGPTRRKDKARRDRTDALRARYEAALKELERVTKERDEALGRGEALERERGEARRDADEALRSLAKVAAERDRAKHAQERALAESESAKRTCDAALQARNAALKSRDHARVSREEAVHARQEAIRARDEAARARDDALRARERDGALPRREVAQLVPPPAASPPAAERSWLKRSLALVALAIALVLVLVLLFS